MTSPTEMRTMIGLLRSGGDEPRTAPDGLDRLDPLLGSARATGLTVEVLDGRAGPLPADVDLVAYRVVQEGLTNAAKHAPGSAVRVEIAEREGTLTVELDNALATGRAGLPGAGTGLLGLRERAEALGGRVEAGPHGEGWRPSTSTTWSTPPSPPGSCSRRSTRPACSPPAGPWPAATASSRRR